MNLVGRAEDTTKINFLERECAIGDNECTESEVPRGARSGFNGIVCAYTDNKHRRLSTGMEPALKAGVDECIRNVFLDDMFVVERGQTRLEFHA